MVTQETLRKVCFLEVEMVTFVEKGNIPECCTLAVKARETYMYLYDVFFLTTRASMSKHPNHCPFTPIPNNRTIENIFDTSYSHYLMFVYPRVQERLLLWLSEIQIIPTNRVVNSSIFVSFSVSLLS